MPVESMSRRRLLQAGTAALAGLAGCPSRGSGPASDPQTPTPTRTPSGEGCETPVGDDRDSVDEPPTPPACPERPDPLRACPVRAFVLGLEKHRRYTRTLERYEGVRRLEFAVEGTTVRAGESGFLVHASVFFGGTAASQTATAGTPTPVHFDDSYAVSYLVTAQRQWRAVDRTGADRASTVPRQDGSEVSCVDAPATETADSSLSVADLSVADFLRYPLAGTHPHVHRRANTQYVVVRADTSLDPRLLRAGLALELDGESVPLADRQPVPWRNDTVDVALAVSKDRSVERGRVLFGGTVLRTLSEATLERLNAPPVFVVSEPSVTADGIRQGERKAVTVSVGVENTGEGAGTFGASLSGNFLSGSKTVTARLDPGTRRELAASVDVVGQRPVRVRLDWGSGEWTTEIPVVGTPTDGATPTPAPQ